MTAVPSHPTEEHRTGSRNKAGLWLLLIGHTKAWFIPGLFPSSPLVNKALKKNYNDHLSTLLGKRILPWAWTKNLHLRCHSDRIL